MISSALADNISIESRLFFHYDGSAQPANASQRHYLKIQIGK